MKKKTGNSVIIIAMAAIPAMANFSGGDDFNGNSMDGAKWVNTETQVGCALEETNGRLELVSSTGPQDFRPVSRTWILNSGSYAQDWSMTYETMNTLDETSIVNNECSIGFWITGSESNGTFVSSKNYFSFSRDKSNYGIAEHDFSVGAAVDDVQVLDATKRLTNDFLAVKLTFSSKTKHLHLFYDEGNGFFPFTSFNTTAWGMTDEDTFTLNLGGGDRGMAIPSGAVYGDNLELFPYIGTVPPNEEALIPCSSIVGSWVTGDSTTEDTVMITFMADGTYFLSHDSSAGFAGGLGMERGTYTWNGNTGAFAATVTVDTNGQGGLSHPGGSVTVTVNGDALNYSSSSESTTPFQRVYSPSTPPSIIGGWYHLDTVNNHDNVVFTFLPNGIYFFAQDGESSFDPNGYDGMERGVYSWDGASLSMEAFTDTCGEWGMDGESGVSSVVSGNTMTWFGDFELSRVVDPQCSDLDGDGLPDVWEQQYYGNPTNAPASGNGDGDELDDRAEFVAGTNPTNGASVFEVSDSGASPAGYVLSWNAVEGRSYGVKWTDSLTNSLMVLTNGIAYPQNSFTDTVHSTEGEGFYSINVKLDE
ncbi:hypothetical protein [Pontiella agarivorans]|uniref:Uncharacterized protein n=1 Tax=Pontiella agarivorans TaxID=3038953 RepID=A0ABU5N0B1_9BACT|nr:hypothetical protein [Pontiella agarivorans]MDZ8119886.1 hypothetical protein [Pontiella agarivorans]